MRCLTPFAVLLLFLAVVLSGYNCWQVHQLRKEVSAMKAEVRSGDRQGGQEQDLASMVKRAQQQAESARRLLASGQVDRARDELSKSLRKLEAASQLSKQMADDAAKNISGAFSNVRKQVESAVDGASSKNDNRRPNNNGPQDNE